MSLAWQVDYLPLSYLGSPKEVSPKEIFLPTVQKGETFSPTLISYLFDNNYSNRCKVTSLCGFDLHFSNDSDVVRILLYLLAICMSSWENM